jgi:predicted nucleic acid-binding protein
VIFLDSNILIDLVDDSHDESGWSQEVMGSLDNPLLVVNFVVLAEVARAFTTPARLLVFLESIGVELKQIDAQTAFRAGQAHSRYRRSSGPRQAILADFLIGAHAATLGATLITRDRGRFSTYFPELTLMTPEQDNG